MIRPILTYPDKRLREPGKDVEEFDAELHALIDDMAETMYAAPGIGLAAPQVGLSMRIILVSETGEEGDEQRDAHRDVRGRSPQAMRGTGGAQDVASGMRRAPSRVEPGPAGASRGLYFAASASRFDTSFQLTTFQKAET